MTGFHDGVKGGNENRSAEKDAWHGNGTEFPGRGALRDTRNSHGEEGEGQEEAQDVHDGRDVQKMVTGENLPSRLISFLADRPGDCNEPGDPALESDVIILDCSE